MNLKQKLPKHHNQLKSKYIHATEILKKTPTSEVEYPTLSLFQVGKNNKFELLIIPELSHIRKDKLKFRVNGKIYVLNSNGYNLLEGLFGNHLRFFIYKNKGEKYYSLFPAPIGRSSFIPERDIKINKKYVSPEERSLEIDTNDDLQRAKEELNEAKDKYITKLRTIQQTILKNKEDIRDILYQNRNMANDVSLNSSEKKGMSEEGSTLEAYSISRRKKKKIIVQEKNINMLNSINKNTRKKLKKNQKKMKKQLKKGDISRLF